MSSEKISEISVHLSLEVPAIVKLNLDVSRKTHVNKHSFFKPVESIEMKLIDKKDTEDISAAMTKL